MVDASSADTPQDNNNDMPPATTSLTVEAPTNGNDNESDFVRIKLNDETRSDVEETGGEFGQFTETRDPARIIRSNVSEQIKNRMRKFSINELNKRRRAAESDKFYRTAFYTVIISLSLIFLYLIYLNLFE